MSEETPTPEQPAASPKLCPKGHVTRTLFGKHRCSGRKCGEDSLAEEKAKKAAVKADPSLRATLMPKPVKRTSELDPAEQASLKQFETRSKLVKLPKNLTGDAATKWSQEKLVSLLPEAVASVAYDLRHGNDRQRADATETILKANGLDKREASQSSGGLIVLNLGQQAVQQVPWLQRMQQAVLPKQTAALTAEQDDE